MSPILFPLTHPSPKPWLPASLLAPRRAIRSRSLRRKSAPLAERVYVARSILVAPIHDDLAWVAATHGCLHTSPTHTTANTTHRACVGARVCACTIPPAGAEVGVLVVMHLAEASTLIVTCRRLRPHTRGATPTHASQAPTSSHSCHRPLIIALRYIVHIVRHLSLSLALSIVFNTGLG